MSNTTFEDDMLTNSRRVSEGNGLTSGRVGNNRNEFLHFLDKSYDANQKNLLMSLSNDQI